MPDSAEPAHAKSETDLLDILRLLIDTKKAKTTADLLKYATQYGAPEAEERLKVLNAEGIPLELAFDAVSVQLRLFAYKRNSDLLVACRGQKVGLLLPLPPHLPDLFLPVADVEFLQPTEGALIGNLHEYSLRSVKGARACRAKAQEMSALVFEAFREGDQFFMDPAIVDVLEPKLLPAGMKLIAHLRPHKNPGDVEYHPPTPVQFI